MDQLDERATVRMTLDEKLALLMMATGDNQTVSAWLRTQIRVLAIKRKVWPPRPNSRIEVLSEGEKD